MPVRAANKLLVLPLLLLRHREWAGPVHGRCAAGWPEMRTGVGGRPTPPPPEVNQAP